MTAKRNTQPAQRVLARVMGETKSAVQYAMEWIVMRVVKYFDEKEISDTGNLRNSIIAEVQCEAARVLGIVGTNVKYAYAVHEGMKKGHLVPIEPLKKWVIHKLGYTGKEAARKAFSVQRKIKKEGTKGRPYFGFILLQYRNRIAEIVGNRIAEKIQG